MGWCLKLRLATHFSECWRVSLTSSVWKATQILKSLSTSAVWNGSSSGETTMHCAVWSYSPPSTKVRDLEFTGASQLQLSLAPKQLRVWNSIFRPQRVARPCWKQYLIGKTETKTELSTTLKQKNFSKRFRSSSDRIGTKTSRSSTKRSTRFKKTIESRLKFYTKTSKSKNKPALLRERFSRYLNFSSPAQ